MDKGTDYIYILKAVGEMPFGVGKKLLIEFLQGKDSQDSIKRNKLDKLDNFGSLAYGESEIDDLIESMLMNGFIEQTPLKTNRFCKVLSLTEKGKLEIENPVFFKKKLSYDYSENNSEITDEDRTLFQALGEFISRYNEGQKKAITSNEKEILCIAGAGSGKTTVLTKRIEFLVKYRSVPPQKILAITFTRKARQEMVDRLSGMDGLSGVNVETFNSFCEKILRNNGEIAYGRFVKVVSYGEKIMLMNRALSKMKTDIKRATALYFTHNQRSEKTEEQLANILMNDCFFVRDYFKFKNKALDEAYSEIDKGNHELRVKLVFNICRSIDEDMQSIGLRDFADQLIDTISLFKSYPALIPQYNHVLVDEYQDVNSTQIKLIDLLSTENLFCVGDPRQSIYGWRGSDISYILNFREKYPSCQVISLKKNYRSVEHIVSLGNLAIKSLGLDNMESGSSGKKELALFKFSSEDEEYEFVAQKILSSNIPRKDIFVLARTNRQLSGLSRFLHNWDIPHVVRSDEINRTASAGEGDVTLATVHAIKGLEAELVMVIGCNGVNFPCKTSEHPVIDLIKVDEYDKEDEERRLFYVAITRAKNSLFMSYTGKKPTRFITHDMLKFIEKNENKKEQVSFDPVKAKSIESALREWRRERCLKEGIPAFMVMSDKTLIEISQNLPSTPRDLENINGIGPAKILMYGEDILKLINP